MELSYNSPEKEVHSLQFKKLSAEVDEFAVIEVLRLEVTLGGLVLHAVHSSMLLRDFFVLGTLGTGIPQPFWAMYSSI